MNDNSNFRRVAEKLSKMAAPKYRGLPIGEDTEVYADLRIYGDEMVSLIWWLQSEFGVETNIDPFKYSPREIPFSFALCPIGKLLGLEQRFESLRVKDILAAIDAKRWPGTDL